MTGAVHSDSAVMVAIAPEREVQYAPPPGLRNTSSLALGATEWPNATWYATPPSRLTA